MQSFDLVSWVLTDVIPRFPGMLSAGKLSHPKQARLNLAQSSCSILPGRTPQSGAQSSRVHYLASTHIRFIPIPRRLLPASALSRVFFPDRNELVNYFTPAALPQGEAISMLLVKIIIDWAPDYGGNLEPLLDLNDPLQSVPSVPVVHHPPRILPSPALSVPDILSTSIFLSPTSALNPFYGYPVAVLGTSASLHHGRRRKRDLARTLLRLLWLRWRGSITSCIWLCLLVFAARLTRRWVLQSRDGREVLRVFLSSASNW